MGLQKSIAFAVIGPPLTVVTPGVWVLVLPSVPGVSLVGLIIGIGGHLVSLPLGFSGLLAGLLGAEALGLDTGIGHKATPAVGTATLAVHGFLLCEAVDLQKRDCPGRIRITTKVEEEGKTGYRNETRGEEKPEGRLLAGIPGSIFNR